MTLRLPAVETSAPHGVLTLGDLRQLVTVAAHLPADLIVRSSVALRQLDLAKSEQAVTRISLDGVASLKHKE